MLRQSPQISVPGAGDGQHPPAPRLHFLKIRDGLLIYVIVRRYEHHRHVLVNQSYGPVLHLRRRIALGVDVRDFLEFERPFQGYREIDTPPQIQEMLCVSVLGSESFYARAQFQDFVYQLRHPGKLRYQLLTLRLAQPPLAPQMEPQQCQRHYLRRERLG